MPAPLLDAHCHVQDEAFAADRAEVMARARQAGVGFFVCNGVSEPDWEALAGLAASDGSILPAYGLHPWYTRQRSHNWREILEHRLSQAPVPVGEIGLDRFLRERDEADMERVFREQLSIARRLERPAFIHCVRAFDWLIEVLRSEPELPAGMLIHACAAPLSAMSELAKRGAYFSFAGTVLAPNNRRAREALLAAPLERLLFETDSPDLPPPPEHRLPVPGDGRYRNEPGNLPVIVREAARLRGLEEYELRARLFDNARRFLGRFYPALRAPEAP